MPGIPPHAGPQLMVAACVLLPIGSPALAQSPDSTPRPGRNRAAYERLAFLEGTWTREPGAFYASGPDETPYTERCAWLAGGRRHMVCHGSFGAGAAAKATIGITSYRPADSTYVYYAAFPSGGTLEYEGRAEADGWLYTLQPNPLIPGGTRLRTRLTRVGDDVLRFVEEASTDGGPWQVTEDYRHRRVADNGRDS